MTPFRQRVLVTTLIIFGVLAAGFFGMRTFHAFREFRGHHPQRPPFDNRPPETDVELIRDWMTIPFIGKMYHVPPPIIFNALNIPMDKNEEKSVKQLNDQYFPENSGFVLDMVKTAVQANLPPPTAMSPATTIPPVTAKPPTSP